LFDAPGRSFGLVRLRATLVQGLPGGDRLLGQRSFVVQRPAPSPDAAGGVHALTVATNTAVEEIEQWLSQFP
ncbi:MAG: membrane integrity-associated transporter subunit PqiC, partial [Rhodoferax sp.]|nr:membrane integrity-associated transporter subunit PqiC [Rhodoferax sp.]